MSEASLRVMVANHVAWQFEHLGIADASIADALVDRFVTDVNEAAAINRRVLATLAEQGLRIGVVSNACGNADVLCDELGYAPFLSVVVDSHRLGIAKPDPAIFTHALDRLQVAASRTAMVGDSLDRDIRPAKALGLLTIWVSESSEASERSVPDMTLQSVADLPGRLLGVLNPA